MKHIATHIFGVLWIITSLHTQAQSIIAGQTSGTNIIYHDIQDLYVASSFWWNSDSKSMDLNDDGVNDLALNTEWIYFSHINYNFLSAGGNPLGLLEYSSLGNHPTWITKHNAGEEINNSLNWHAENGLFYSLSSTNGAAGNFSGEGYLAYRICNSDTLYGWIRIKSNVSGSGAYLTAYEYAYVINYTGLPQEMGVTFDNIIRKAGNYLLVNLPDGHFSHTHCLYGLDVTGRQVFQFDLTPGSHCLNISGYPHGLYILRIADTRGRTFSGKMTF